MTPSVLFKTRGSVLTLFEVCSLSPMLVKEQHAGHCHAWSCFVLSSGSLPMKIKGHIVGDVDFAHHDTLALVLNQMLPCFQAEVVYISP